MLKEELLRIKVPRRWLSARAAQVAAGSRAWRAAVTTVHAFNPRTTFSRIVRSRLPFGFVAVVLAVGASFADATTAAATEASMTFEQRLNCRTRLEDLRWSHTIWPASNPEPKPQRATVLPDSTVRAQLEDSLRMESALRVRYGIVIDEEALQIEINRIAISTRAPDQLREQFDSLGNDPNRIAECLIRPLLVGRHLRNSYAFDNRLHGDLRDIAELALAGEIDANAIARSGGIESTVVYRLDDGSRGGAEPRAAGTREVRADLRTMTELRLSYRKDSLLITDPRRPATPHPGLTETTEAFVDSFIVKDEPSHIVVSHRAWRKQPFDDWWTTEREQHAVAAPVMPKALKLRHSAGPSGGSTKTGAEFWSAPPQWPSARNSHTAVWTGTEMIIWGGSDSAVFVNSGSRYNPASDTWTALPTAGAPSPRAGHSVVWTGSEMIVWGGEFVDSGLVGTRLGDGARFNVATNSWSSLSSSGAPAPRRSHTAVWTGSEMIVWGGGLNSGARYLAANGSWAPMSTAGGPSLRSGESVTWTGTELVVWGGFAPGDFQVIPLATGARYNSSADQWTQMSNLNAPLARGAHTAVWTGSEIVVWGGYTNNPEEQPSSGARYNPASDLWIQLPNGGAPSGRFDHTAVWTGNEMFVWGGTSITNGFWLAANTGARFNTTTNAWSTITTVGAPRGRSSHTAVWTGSEVIVWGGIGGARFDSGARFRPASGVWVPMLPSTPEPRVGHTAVWTGSEMIVWGGYATNYPLASGGRYDPVFDYWRPTRTTGAPSARSGHTAVWSGAEMLVWGADEAPAVGTGARYAPGADSWTPITTTSAPRTRVEHSAIWTGSEMIVWGGNEGGGDPLNSGGRYQPASDTWSHVSDLQAPQGRNSHTAVWTGSEMLIWGGSDRTGYPEMGARYDPLKDRWVGISAVGAPTPRRNHTAVWTGSEMLIWGGDLGGGRYAPSTDSWLTLFLFGEPLRTQHIAVWTGSEMIVWGGTFSGTMASSTNTGIRYNPAENQWRPVTSTGAPRARVSHAAVWTGNGLVIFGGYTSPQIGSFLNDYPIYYPYGLFPSRVFGDGFEAP